MQTFYGAPVKLVTSIVPKLTRCTAKGVDVGGDYLAECIESWLASGSDIITVNTEDERQRLEDAISKSVHRVTADRVDALYTDKYGPTLRALFDATKGAGIAGFFNADTFVPTGIRLGDVLSSEARNCFILVRRTDVEAIGERYIRVNEGGYDAMFFDRKLFAPVFEAPEFRPFQMGVPWWDLIIPVAASFHGPLAHFPEPFLLHMDHGKSWNGESYRHVGRIARDSILAYARRLSGISEDARRFADEFVALQSKLDVQKQRKHLFAWQEFYRQWIWKRAKGRLIDRIAAASDPVLRQSFIATMRRSDRTVLQLDLIDSGAPLLTVLGAFLSDLSNTFRLVGRRLEQWIRYGIRRKTANPSP